MTHEKQTSNSSESLNRRQKLLRRAVPLALLVAGGTVAGVEKSNDSPDSQEMVASASVMVHAQALGEFGGSESDWGHGTAEDLIKQAVYEGAAKGLANIHIDSELDDAPDYDLKEIVSELPVFLQADQALEMAGYTDITPDNGDQMLVSVAVTTEKSSDSAPVISYEVTDASIKDLPNNQQ